ncbi:MAG: Mrp/NBP35 family ATP-binding protein [Acidimicrobiales bacterium]
MTVDQHQLMEALRPVTDPELGVSIVELDMVRRVEATADGRVAVTVALTVAGCPLRAEITRRVTDALSVVAGVTGVEVDLIVMTPEELGRVRERLGAGRQGQGGGSGKSAGPREFGGLGSRTRVIGISSGKGGVGKSTVTVNLAVSLARAGYDVGLLDADVYGFSVPAMLGVDTDPEVRDSRLVPPVAFGVRCMSMGFFVPDNQPVVWRGPMLHKALEQFLKDVEWGEPDFLLVDMPPGTGDVALSMAEYLPATEVYVVTTPQPAAKRVAQRSAAMAKKVNLPVRGVIENMSWFSGDDGTRYELFGRGGGAQLAEELGVPLLGQVPLVPALREGGDVGSPVSATDPDSEAAAAFTLIANEVVERGRTRVFHPELSIR